MSEGINPTNELSSYDLNDKAQKSREERKAFTEKFLHGELSIEQLWEFSSAYPSIRKIKLLDLVKQLPSWDEKTAKQAFIAHGIAVDARISHLRSGGVLTSIKMLVDSSSTAWRQRAKAPKGWPWEGNVLHVLDQFKQGDLPLELREGYRYYMDEEKSVEDSDENSLLLDILNSDMSDTAQDFEPDIDSMSDSSNDDEDTDNDDNDDDILSLEEIMGLD